MRHQEVRTAETMLSPENKPLFEYIKNKEGKKCGILLAYIHPPNKVLVGFSMCNIKKEPFNSKIGKIIAVNRSMKTRSIPSMIKKKLPDFIRRCNKYYKDKEIDIPWANNI